MASSFENFCGGTFFDLNQTWYTNDPEFSECIQDSLLAWAPCGLLWVLLPFYTCYIRDSKLVPIAVNKLNTIKTLLSLFLVFVTLIDLFKGVSDLGTDPPPAHILLVTPAVLTVTFILTTILIQVDRVKGCVTSGPLFIFWFFLTVAGIPKFHYKVKHAVNDGRIDDEFRFVTFFIYYALVLLQLILSCKSDTTRRPEYDPMERPSPEIQASFLSYLTFWWLNKLILTGYKKTLESGDLWDMNPRDVTKNNAPYFLESWNKELEKTKRKNEKLESKLKHQKSRIVHVDVGFNKDSNETTPLLTGSGSKKKFTEPNEPEVVLPEDKKKTPSLFWVLTKCYGPTMMKAWMCKVIYDLQQFVGPTLQSLLIGYTEDPNEEIWKGYIYAAVFLVNGVVQSMFFHQLFHIGMTLGMRVKASIISAVYKKALTMTNEARKDSTVGEIVNLMSVDAQRLQDVIGYLWMFWSAPLQISLAVYLLWGVLGPSTLAGLAVMILLIPVNGVLGAYQRKLMVTQMKLKDARIKLMNEVLNGMKVLKLYAWELSFQDKVNVIREKELANLKKSAYLSAVGSFTWTCAPFLVTIATFTTYVIVSPEHTLDASKAFVSLSLFNILRFPINLLPMMISYIVMASVSIKRLGKFLRTGDLDRDNVQHNPRSPDPIAVEDGVFSWGQKDPIVLQNINLRISDGGLVAVVGQVGAGKSSLISALLGEMIKLKGRVNVRGSVAYVAQQAWIQNATVRDNILFGKEYNQIKYEKILDACALRADLDILPGGDQTEIGEKGINLSGGQKQRVSLARAVYNDADIYYLDDPLSAVDSHVGKHIFENVIGPKSMLKHKTRVLVTHGVHWLPFVDQVVVISDNQISEVGSYEELLSHNGAFAQFLKTYLTQEIQEEEDEEGSGGELSEADVESLIDSIDEEVSAVEEEFSEIKKRILQRVESIPDGGGATSGGVTSGDERASPTHKGRRRRRKSTRRSSVSSHHDEKTLIEKEAKKREENKLTEEEKSAVGQVDKRVYLEYLTALGLWMASGIFFFFALYQGASIFSNIWLSQWTEDPLLKNKSVPTNNSEKVFKINMYLGIYGASGVLQAITVLLYAFVTAFGMIKASRVMHAKMLSNILRSPMSFFDTTPLGRILNRFSRDIETIDNNLPALFRSWINTVFTVFSTIIVISYSTPIFLAVILPLGILYYFIQRFYIPTSRQLKRIESTTRSPIYTHFSETIAGSSTIRAYGVNDQFILEEERKVDHNLVFYFAQIASNRWLGFRLEFLGSLIVFSAAMFAVISKQSGISGGLVGLSISYALQITGSLNWAVRMTSDLETNIVSVERVKEYSETPTEDEWHREETAPSQQWPEAGKVVFEGYQTRYREGLDLVLRGIDANIVGGEKVGIVGRTGAGKSSLTLCLFRIIEAAGGAIFIDGVNIAHLGLHQLRSKLTILPQDPVLFSGSLRMNLDPFDVYSDEECWEALEHAHLKNYVSGLAAGLEHECGEGGQNLSVGQRQLVCLARTLLHKTKILILDEATAAVDLETDELIQQTIRAEFADCTILTIAHRLNTIMDNDRVMVLDTGKIAEFDTPNALLENKDSIFYGMAKDAGLT
ncbi:unnamed protein product [Owenia fusiformis]|uniref:ABC-type glutathione-S-conjugate transporter n=1 Tax=Owenia fusiformis TaxID=6347 RepID=A0A8J1TJ18_OWEFU|nr:unnamed protein product [Owenia fusiformis]